MPTGKQSDPDSEFYILPPFHSRYILTFIKKHSMTFPNKMYANEKYPSTRDAPQY